MNDVKSVEDVIADAKLKQYLKELVIERINVMPNGMKIAIGDVESSSAEILNHVENEDAIGIQMMEMELEYLRALSTGGLYA
jgi:hypothetical protein